MVISRPFDRVVARITPFGWIEYRGTRSTAATYPVANGLLPIDLELQHEPANGKARTNHGVRAPCSRYQTLIHRNGCTARHSNPLPACLASHGVVSFGTMRRCRAAAVVCGHGSNQINQIHRRRRTGPSLAWRPPAAEFLSATQPQIRACKTDLSATPEQPTDPAAVTSEISDDPPAAANNRTRRARRRSNRGRCKYWSMIFIFATLF